MSQETPNETLAAPLKIAAFDFVGRSFLIVEYAADVSSQDSTLITTASGNKFARNPGDWKWWDACVPSKLNSLLSQG
jgi:bifunctional polynucleotide phosphatase/kinase